MVTGQTTPWRGPASGVRWTYLTRGDAIDFGTATVTPAGSPLVGPGAGPAEIIDAWDSIDGPGNVHSLRDLAHSRSSPPAPRARMG
jgi:hypothetical protein